MCNMYDLIYGVSYAKYNPNRSKNEEEKEKKMVPFYLIFIIKSH